ncbi:MAG: hypothetical protein QOJ89_4766 [bacterium]|jgi:hypothetical protein
MRLSKTILSASVLTALAAAAPAPAATVSSAGVRGPQLAVNADGATVVAWERLTKRAIAIEARAGDAPLELARTRRLSSSGHEPQVAVGADGTKAVMWSEEVRNLRSIRVAVARPGHGFGKGQLVDRRSGNMRVMGIAIQPTGRVVAIWQRSASRLAFALARRNHAFGKPSVLAAMSRPAAGPIPVDPRDGSVTVAYSTQVGVSPPANPQAAVQTLAMSATTFSAPTIVSQGPGTNLFQDAFTSLASGPAGVAVAFVQTGDPASLNLVRRQPDGSWGARELIAATTYGPDVFPSGLRATLPQDGSAVAAWSLDQGGPGLGGTISTQIVANMARASSPFGPAQPLTAAGEHFGVPAVASAGDAAFVAIAEPGGRVLLTMRAASATAFGTPVALTGDGDGDVLLAAAGERVVAAYQRRDRLQVVVVR